MKNKNAIIHRIVPNIYSDDLEKSKQFYLDFLEMDLVMDMEWILTFASKENSSAQISILQNDKKAKLDNSAIFISVEVSNIDAFYDKAKQRQLKITYPITNEPWGVTRFFVEDPNGVTFNLLSH